MGRWCVCSVGLCFIGLFVRSMVCLFDGAVGAFVWVRLFVGSLVQLFVVSSWVGGSFVRLFDGLFM